MRSNPSIPLLLGLAVFTAYALTLTCAHSGDDLQWIMRVESAATGVPLPHPADLVTPSSADATARFWYPQPRYLLALPTAVGLFDAARRLGWSGRAVRPIQLAHAVFGALGVVWFCLALRQVIPTRWSVVASLGLASSYAWWHYSTHLDYPIAANALSCLFLYLLLEPLRTDPRRRSAWRAFALGIVAALATLYLLTRVVLVAVAAVTLAAPARPRTAITRLRGAPARFVTGLVVGLSLILGLGALGSVRVTGSLPALAGVWRDATYAGSYAHDVAVLDAPKALYGFAKSLVVYPAAGLAEPREVLASADLLTRVGLLAWYAIVAIVALAPFVLLALNWRIMQAQRVPVIAMVSWFVLELPFVVYWEPTYVKWLVGLLIPWWGLVGMLAALAFAGRPAARRIFLVALAALVAVVFGVNLIWNVRPGSRCDLNPWLRTTHDLMQLSQPADLFVDVQTDLLDFYLPYFGQRSALSVEHAASVRDDVTGATVAVRALIESTLQRGGRLYVYPCREADLRRLRALAAAAQMRFEPVALDHPTPRDLPLCRTVGSLL